MTAILEAYGLSHLSRDKMLELRDALQNAADVPHPSSDISDSFREELRRRSAEIDANPDDCIPYDVVMKRVREKIGL